MKKILLISFMMILLCFLSFRTYATGVKEVEILDSKIKIPKFSFLLEKEENQIIVKNIRSFNNIKKEVQNILSTYKKITCNHKTYYYNEKEDYTIVEYKIKDYKFFNSLIFLIEKKDKCKEVTLQ